MAMVGSLLQRVYSNISWVPYPRFTLPLILDQVIYYTLRVKLQTLNAHYWSRAVLYIYFPLRIIQQLSSEKAYLEFGSFICYIAYKLLHYIFVCESQKPFQYILQADADKSAEKVRDEIIFCLSNNPHLSLQHIERFLRENNGNFYIQASPVGNPVKLDGTSAYYTMDLVPYKIDGYTENFINLLLTGFVAYPNDSDITRGILTRAQNQLAIRARAASELRLSQLSSSDAIGSPAAISLEEILQRSEILEADRVKNKPILYEKIMLCLQQYSRVTLQDIERFLRKNNCHFMLWATRVFRDPTPMTLQGEPKPNIVMLNEYEHIYTLALYRERFENLSNAGFLPQDYDTRTVRTILEQAQRRHQQQNPPASVPLISGACSSPSASSASPVYAASSSSSRPGQSLLPGGFSPTPRPIEETFKGSGILKAEKANNGPLFYERVILYLHQNPHITLSDIEQFLTKANPVSRNFLLTAKDPGREEIPLALTGEPRKYKVLVSRFTSERKLKHDRLYFNRFEILKNAGFVSIEDDPLPIRPVLENAQRLYRENHSQQSPAISKSCRPASPPPARPQPAVITNALPVNASSPSEKANAPSSTIVASIIPPNCNLQLKKLLEDPPDLCCPIDLTLFVDPVVASDEKSYEREGLTKWLKTHKESLFDENHILDPNKTNGNADLKSRVHAYRQKTIEKCAKLATELLQKKDFDNVKRLIDRMDQLDLAGKKSPSDKKNPNEVHGRLKKLREDYEKAQKSSDDPESSQSVGKSRSARAPHS